VAEKQKKKNDPNWIKIQTEFETSDVKLSVLARKYGIPYPTIRDRSRRESWERKTTESRKEIVKLTSKKVFEKIADKNAYEISVELEATNLINQLILETLQDKSQFKKHLVTMKKSESIAGVGSESKQWVESKELDVVDTKRLQAAAAALKVSAELKRLLTNVIDADKREKLSIDKEKLELEKKNEKDTVINVIHNIPRAPVTAEEPEEVLD